MNKQIFLLLSLLALAACQSTPPTSSITCAAAEKIALAKVKGGHINDGELEKEGGIWVWSFDIAQPGTKNIREIHVDAQSGKIVADEIETPESEAAEHAKEHKA